MIIEETELFDKVILIGGDLGYANKARTKALTINDYGDGYRIRLFESNGDFKWQRIDNTPIQLPVKPVNGDLKIIKRDLYTEFLIEFKEEFENVKPLTPNLIFNWLVNKIR